MLRNAQEEKRRAEAAAATSHQNKLNALQTQMRLDRENAERKTQDMLNRQRKDDEQRMAANARQQLTRKENNFEAQLQRLRGELNSARHDYQNLQQQARNAQRNRSSSSCVVQ